MNRLINRLDSIDKAQLKKDLEASGYTYEQFATALVTISSYSITLGLYEVYEQVKRIDNALRNQPDCKRTGYKMELNALIAATRESKAQESIIIINDIDRIRIMQTETHEYHTRNLDLMHYGCENWLGSKQFANPKIMAPVLTGIAITSMVIELVEERAKEVEQVRPGYSIVDRMKPQIILNSLRKLADRIDKLYPGCEADINKCEALKIGVRAMKSQIFDLNLMELHCAYGLEETKGKQWLKTESPEAYKMLHFQ